MEIASHSDRLNNRQSQSTNQIKSKYPPIIPQQIQDEESKKARKIKKLMIMNQQLIQTLKKQDQQLTRKIKQQKIKPHNRSFSFRQKPIINNRQTQSTKRQLSNAYKQISVYKNIVQDIKEKQFTGDAIDKIRLLQSKISMQQKTIEKYQIQLKTISLKRDNQVKQLKNFQNDKLKNTVVTLQQKAIKLRDQYKKCKKNLLDRQEIDQRLQKYQVQLQKNMRKANNKFYPGIQQKKGSVSQDQFFNNNSISQKEWQIVKSQLQQMKKSNQEYIKKEDLIHRMKVKQIKSLEQSQLKLKQKNRILLSLQNKIKELTKLTIVNQGVYQDEKQQQQQKTKQLQQSASKPKTKQQIMIQIKQKALKRNQGGGQMARQVKKWAIPQGYCLQRGKILPDSIFFSDKPVLKDTKKSKIDSVSVWIDGDGLPNAVQFFYRDQNNLVYQGIQPIQNLPQDLNLVNWNLTQGDYLYSVKGQFLQSKISCLTFKSKFGKEITFKNQNSAQKGDEFKFEPKPNEIPSCFFGAYVQNKQQGFEMCHIGCQFIQDW